MLALRAGNPYKSESLTFQPGDTLVLYSDGITEAENPQEEQFESERLMQSMAGAAERSASEVATRLLADVRAFAGGAAQTDDITIVSVRKT